MEQSQNSNVNLNSSRAEGMKGALANRSDYLADKAGDLLKKNEDHAEGKATKTIEMQTAKIPSGVYLNLAIGSMVLSAALATSTKRRDLANFVGLWAPSFLMLGIYNKIVKVQGSDRGFSS